VAWDGDVIVTADTVAVDPVAACPNEVLAWAWTNAATCDPSWTKASRRGIGALPLKTVFQLAVIAATAAGPLVGSAVLVLAVAGGLPDFAEELLPPPQAARIRHPAAAITAHTGRSSGQCRQRIVAVCHTKGRARTDAADDQHFEYLGCHPGTGLLRVLPRPEMLSS
jgi:hypothetical protein